MAQFSSTTMPPITPANQSSLSSGPAATRLALIWQIGEVYLTATGNEIRLPLNIGRQLQAHEFAELERRLSERFLGARVYRFEDPQLGIMRIFATCDATRAAGSPSTSTVAADSAPSPTTTATPSFMEPYSSSPASEKRTKVPRPPNAFILYRKEWHPKIMEQNPGMHNNDVSVLLGKQWKAESTEVRQVFKDKAEQIKSRHATENPGYQYAPRKSSERKRRMTARKLALLQQDHGAENIASSQPSLTPSTSSQPASIAATQPHESGLMGQTALPNFDDLFMLDHYSDMQHNADFGFEYSLPLNAQASRELNAQAAGLTGTPFDAESFNALTQTSSAALQNDVDLMNCLIDFDGFTKSVKTVYDGALDSMAMLDDVDSALPHFAPFDATNFAAIQAELERTFNLPH